MRSFVLVLVWVLQTQLAAASVITLSFSGNESDSLGPVDFPANGIFSGSISIDTTASRDPNSGFFTFLDAVTSIEVNTSLGSIFYDPLAADPFYLGQDFADQLNQIDITNAQTLTALGGIPFGPPENLGQPTNLGFTGAIDGLTPFAYGFSFVSSGSSDVFFTDPAVLLSGIESLSDDEFVGGVIAFLTASGEIELYFSDFDIEGFSSMPPPAEVPIPGALPLLLSGLAGIGVFHRRKRVSRT